VAARELREQVGGDLRRVRERLVVHRRQQRHDGERVVRGDEQLRVVGAEPLRDGARVRRLVVLALSEADRIRAHRPAALHLRERDDGR